MIFPKGTPINKVNYDRTTKATFHCTEHPDKVWRSKDPRLSSWFPVDESVPDVCGHTAAAYILAEDYDNGVYFG